MTEIKLRMKDGKEKTFKQDFIPMRKQLEYAEIEKDFLANKDEDGNSPTNIELAKLQAEFVAGLFDDKEVTVDAILDGLPCGNNTVSEIIFYDVLGFQRDELIGESEGK